MVHGGSLSYGDDGILESISACGIWDFIIVMEEVFQKSQMLKIFILTNQKLNCEDKISLSPIII